MYRKINKYRKFGRFTMFTECTFTLEFKRDLTTTEP